MTTKKDIKLKDGSILPKGSPVTFDGTSICLVMGKRVRITSAFPTPSISTMEKWNNNGVCKTATGAKVEPDGIDSYGCPSWLMVMGLV